MNRPQRTNTPMRALAKELKNDERLDLALKKELKSVAADIVPPARAAALRAHPSAKDPRRPGEWRWGSLVKAITAGADQDGPFVKLNADKLPGAYGFVFGSNKRPQFPPRRPTGYFLFPQVEEAKPEAEKRVAAVVAEYLQQLGGD